MKNGLALDVISAQNMARDITKEWSTNKAIKITDETRLINLIGFQEWEPRAAIDLYDLLHLLEKQIDLEFPDELFIEVPYGGHKTFGGIIYFIESEKQKKGAVKSATHITQIKRADQLVPVKEEDIAGI